MVFFTAILITAILYYLQADGLIYVLAVALVAELTNLFLGHLIAKTVEKKIKTKSNAVVNRYKKEAGNAEFRIEELVKTQNQYAAAAYEAKSKIKKKDQQIAVLKGKLDEMEKRVNRYENLPSGSLKRDDHFL
ncbi:MAG: hypothetical protein U9P10_08530 [Thermodesulfobacteriota bacterium]|nr:hypothetical protein [Thermodesulfobacteriota bacterium]